MIDPYATEAARLRAVIQTHLREGSEPTLTPYEQFLLCGWYERHIARVETERDRLGNLVDVNYAARLNAERGHLRAVEALDDDGGGRAGP